MRLKKEIKMILNQAITKPVFHTLLETIATEFPDTDAYQDAKMFTNHQAITDAFFRRFGRRNLRYSTEEFMDYLGNSLREYLP